MHAHIYVYIYTCKYIKSRTAAGQLFEEAVRSLLVRFEIIRFTGPDAVRAGSNQVVLGNERLFVGIKKEKQ